MQKRLLFFSLIVTTAFMLFIFFRPSNYKPTLCSSITSIKPYIEPGCLVAIDFDNTLFECVDEHMGSDQWFSAGIKYFIEHDKLQPQSALKKMLSIYMAVHETALIKPIEPTTIPFLQSLKESGIKVLILTSRSIIPQTMRQLKNIQASQHTQFSFEPFHLSKSKLTLPLTQEAAHYQQGILFCGKNNKGEALAALLDSIALRPTKIIFIDDRESHIISVEKVVRSINISFIGLRYTYLDEKIKNYKLNPKSLSLPTIHSDTAFAY